MEDQDPDLVPTQPAGSQAAEAGSQAAEQHKDADPEPSEEEQPEAGPSTRKSGAKPSAQASPTRKTRARK